MASSNTLGNSIDEDELESEFADLQQQALDDTIMGNTVPQNDHKLNLPSAARTEREHLHLKGLMHVLTLPVPGKRPVRVEEDDEEEELRKLQAEMAM
ncbi:hypothetical protein MRB53_037886 [Persea americana]|nr:hypothetical protein MRB53_037886 [Persea americana]